MNVVGIVAEFNPFHLGHKYLFHSIRRLFPSSCIICIMSGNFTQRGEIALCHKWSRAAMAVSSGADLVVELPFAQAVRSAYYFARGAIQLLDACQVADTIAFGSENGSIELLQAISAFLADESPAFQQELQKHLAEGLSFPLARSLSLQAILPAILNIPPQTLATVLSQPNNILAIEYLLNIERLGSRLRPITFARTGQPFGSLALEGVASASAIRFALLSDPSDTAWHQQMPPGARESLEREIKAGRAPVAVEGLETALLAKLRTIDKERLEQLAEAGEGLHNRLKEAAERSSSYYEMRARIKSKRYSMTRINRLILYALLDFTALQAAEFDASGPQYIRVLAFSLAGQKLIKTIKASSGLPVLGRGQDVKDFHQRNKSPLAAAMIDLDIRAGSLYTLAYPEIAERRGLPDYLYSSQPIAPGAQ